MEDSELIRALQVHRLDSKKIRVGAKHDGGYVINEAVLSASSRLISLGIAREDTFERDYIKMKPDSVVECYDGSVDCGLLCSSNPEKVLRQIFHTRRHVGNEMGQISLKDVLKNKNKVLLKIDIEGGEYSLFENSDLSGVVGLVMEFHHLKIANKRIEAVSIIKEKLKDFVIFHVHANSYGPCFELKCEEVTIKDFPNTIELSFARSNLCEKLGLDKDSFPLHGLDSSNDRRRKDISLGWINSIV